MNHKNVIINYSSVSVKLYLLSQSIDKIVDDNYTPTKVVLTNY